jgi:dienelactone hydrolase
MNETSHLRDLSTMTVTPTTTPVPAPTPVEPKGAVGAMTTVYVPKGKESMVGDLPLYTVGSGKNAVVYFYDIYGLNGGRTKEICDRYADNGYIVFLPDFFRGKYKDKPNDTYVQADYTWLKTNSDLTTILYPYLEKMGIKKMTFVGACWGGYMTFEASSSVQAIQGVSFHPAMGQGAPQTPEAIAGRAIVPQYVCASKQEPDSMKPNGTVDVLLKAMTFGAKNIFKAYNNENHGFVSRGDLTNVDTAKAVEDCLSGSLVFVKSNDPLPKTSSAGILSIGLALVSMFMMILF